MLRRGKKFLERAAQAYDKGGIANILEGAPKFARERLPVGLWPPLLIDQRHAADAAVTLPEKPSLDVAFDGWVHDAAPRQLANFEGRISSPENAVYVFEGADVAGRNPVAHVDGKALLPSWFGVDSAFFLHQNMFLKRNYPLSRAARRAVAEPKPSRRLESGFLLLTERGSGRYGWFHETLPKLQWYEEYCELTGESPVLILNSPASPFQRKTLRWMGYDPDDWLEHGDEVTRVGRLVVAPHPVRLEGNPSRGFASEPGWAGERIRSNVPEVDAEFSERVYVSRADADRRRVRNEREVLDVLEPRGFERYEPGRLSLTEQVTLFANAETVVGLHGLAYYNLMFCTRGMRLVELFAEDGVDESYFVAANELDMPYEYMECEPVDTWKHQRPINRDVVVDTDRLETIVDAMLLERPVASD